MRDLICLQKRTAFGWKAIGSWSETSALVLAHEDIFSRMYDVLKKPKELPPARRLRFIVTSDVMDEINRQAFRNRKSVYPEDRMPDPCTVWRDIPVEVEVSREVQ